MLPVTNRALVTLSLLLPGTSQDGTRPRRNNAQVGAGTLQFTTLALADGTLNMSTKAGRAAPGLPAGGRPRGPRRHQLRAGRVRRPRRRRRQRRHARRHERVQRRGVRVLPQQGDGSARRADAGGPRRERTGAAGLLARISSAARWADRSSATGCTSSSRRNRPARRSPIASRPAARTSTRNTKGSSPIPGATGSFSSAATCS